MVITSRNNELIKSVRALKQKKGRDEQNAFLVEGEKLVDEAIKAGWQIANIFATEKKAEKYASKSPVLVSESVLSSLSDEVTPQGVVAVVKIPKSGAITPLTHCLLLDRVQDPGNVGAILRIAVACGIKQILSIDCADVYSPKVVRSSMSGIFKVNVTKISEQNAITLLRENGIPLLVADMLGDNLFEFNPPKGFCLCVGNEGNGISQNLKEFATHKISIPMKGELESLNVAVATGVALYTLLNHK